MQPLTKIEILNHNDFAAVLLLTNGYSLYTLYPGGDHLHYYFFDRKDNIIFSGSDYKPAPRYNIDGVESLVSLLGFLCVRRGDTDNEYFKNYTQAQIEWSESNTCLELQSLINDYDYCDPEYKKAHKDAVKFFNKNYYQDIDKLNKALSKPPRFIRVNGLRVYVFDNGCETIDRYTIVLSDCDVYGCSDNPFNPLGFAQFSHNIADNYMITAYGANWRERCNVKQILKEQFNKYIQDNKRGSSIGVPIDPRTLNSAVLQYINQITK